MYGTPKIFLSKVIQDHFKIGSIPETGMGRIFQTLSQHQDLIDKTKTFLNSFQDRDIEEATIILRQHAYDLYMMLPQTIIMMANKHLVKKGKQEWDVTAATTDKEFYEFFKTAIRVAHEQQLTLIGHETDTSTMNSVEEVFLIKNAGTQEDGNKKNTEEQRNSSSPSLNRSPKRTAPGTGLPDDRKINHIDTKTVVNENKDTKCKFCEARESLHLQDESGNNFEFKKGQRKHYLEARDKNIIQFQEHCGYFMKLTVQDKKQVLKKLKLCQVCATLHSDHGKYFTTNTPCKKIWKKRRAAHVRCRGNGPQNCLTYWPLCHDHIKENANRNKRQFKICGWNKNQEVDIHQMKENLINKQAQSDHENDQLQNQNQHIHPEQQDQLINN